MAVVSLDLFKAHVRADDFDADNVYLEHLLAVAEDTVIIATNRTREDLIEMGAGTFPKMLAHAIMMLGAHWYNQRESVSVGQMNEVPDTLHALIKPYRKLEVCKQAE